jgi:formate hydrogenlyase subunit 3/multisubunit Na+/H+ antiporter MnhD subunit
MNETDTRTALLVATVAWPLALLAACAWAPVRRRMLAWLSIAPLPGLIAALGGSVPARLFGDGNVPLAVGLDRPGAILLGVASLLWIAAGAFAASYLRDTPHGNRFAAFWLLALSGCLGVFVVADLVSLYLMLGVLTCGACGMVIHDQTPRAWRSGAFYLGLALAGETALLMAMVMLAQVTPSGSLLIGDAAAALTSAPHRGWILALMIAGLGLKAGLVPLHVWMPMAHAAAPMPASAVLSGAVVKVGIIGLIRLLPFDAATPDWGTFLTVAGLLTAFYGVGVGLTQAHPKAVLAYSSVSQMGLIVAVLGMGLTTGDAVAGVAAAYYAAHHVLVKGALFLAVGIVAMTPADRVRPIVIVTTVLALSIAGLPLSGGALVKYGIKAPLGEGLVAALAIASAAASTMLMLHFVHRLRRFAPASVDRRAGVGMLLPWSLLALACIAVPWGMYLALPAGTIDNPVALRSLWKAAWPMLAGALLLWVIHRSARGRLPRIPEGDVALAIDGVLPALRALTANIERLDGALRRWPPAVIALALIALLFGAAFSAG